MEKKQLRGGFACLFGARSAPRRSHPLREGLFWDRSKSKSLPKIDFWSIDLHFGRQKCYPKGVPKKTWKCMNNWSTNGRFLDVKTFESVVRVTNFMAFAISENDEKSMPKRHPKNINNQRKIAPGPQEQEGVWGSTSILFFLFMQTICIPPTPAGPVSCFFGNGVFSIFVVFSFVLSDPFLDGLWRISYPILAPL